MASCKGCSVTKAAPRDLLVCRFYEITTIYGESIEEVIHGEYGNGITHH